MSDTPRTEAEANRPHGPLDGIVTIDADFAAQLERELNAANAEIERLTSKVSQLYEGAEEQKQRVERLENCIHRASMAFFRDGSDGQVASGMLAILEEERSQKP